MTSEAQKEIAALAESRSTFVKRWAGVASAVTAIYFATVTLTQLEPIYHFSLRYFMRVLEKTIQDGGDGSLEDRFALALFRGVSRSMFQKDRLTFATLLAVGNVKRRSGIPDSEWSFCVAFGSRFNLNLRDLRLRMIFLCSFWIAA